MSGDWEGVNCQICPFRSKMDKSIQRALPAGTTNQNMPSYEVVMYLGNVCKSNQTQALYAYLFATFHTRVLVRRCLVTRFHLPRRYMTLLPFSPRVKVAELEITSSLQIARCLINTTLRSIVEWSDLYWMIEHATLTLWSVGTHVQTPREGREN